MVLDCWFEKNNYETNTKENTNVVFSGLLPICKNNDFHTFIFVLFILKEQ